MAAYALVRYRLPAADLIKAFLLSPIVLPKIVLGVALFMFFVRVRTARQLFEPAGHPCAGRPAVRHRDGQRRAGQFRLDAAGGRDGPRRRPAARRSSASSCRRSRVSVVIAGLFAFITSFDQVETTIFMVRAGQQHAAGRDVPLSAEVAGPDHRRAVVAADPVRRSCSSACSASWLRGRKLPFIRNVPSETPHDQFHTAADAPGFADLLAQLDGPRMMEHLRGVRPLDQVFRLARGARKPANMSRPR